MWAQIWMSSILDWFGDDKATDRWRKLTNCQDELKGSTNEMIKMDRTPWELQAVSRSSWGGASEAHIYGWVDFLTKMVNSMRMNAQIFNHTKMALLSWPLQIAKTYIDPSVKNWNCSCSYCQESYRVESPTGMASQGSGDFRTQKITHSHQREFKEASGLKGRSKLQLATFTARGEHKSMSNSSAVIDETGRTIHRY